MTLVEPPQAPVSGQLPDLPAVRNEAEKAAELARMKRNATGLLAVAALVFAVAAYYEDRAGWVVWVRVAAEAAMVGGLADWFAVTALFRHPLGLPIPHTAIIPTRKQRIARILADFFERNFFTPEVVAARLHEFGMAERLGRWLAAPETSGTLARQIVSAAAEGARAIPAESAQAFVDRSVIGRLRAVPAAPVAAQALTTLTAGAKHQALLDQVLAVLGRALDRNEAFIRGRIAAESPWWVPGAAEEKLAAKVMGAISRTLEEVSADEAHPLRQQFDDAVQGFIRQLQESPETAARAEQIKADLLASPAVAELGATLWADVRGALERGAAAAEPPAEIAAALEAFGRTLLADAGLRDRLDASIATTIAQLAEEHRSQVGRLIEETVARWDGAETARRLELQVGRDLQYVRINGTIVGGLVGLGLHALRTLLER